MKNEFANRQNMHLTVLALLADPAHQPAWKDQKPALFSTRATALAPKVNALTGLISGQQADTYALAGDRSDEDALALALARDAELESGAVAPISHGDLMTRLRR